MFILLVENPFTGTKVYVSSEGDTRDAFAQKCRKVFVRDLKRAVENNKIEDTSTSLFSPERGYGEIHFGFRNCTRYQIVEKIKQL